MANELVRGISGFASLQMAAEGFLIDPLDPGSSFDDPATLARRLVLGNTHASKFALTLADDFVAQYQVLAQYRNDPVLTSGTGFSGTLFRNRITDELTLSFRSTEFIDDAVRDSKATNELEVKEIGWALGQIAEMERWYKDVLLGDSRL